ncbi:ABC transporter permease [Agrobacterium tumefaciens]|nr:ABC transporter permease [Agrobacterium tumefaciens]
MLYIMPGDPVRLLLGAESNPSPEAIAAMRHQLGLDQPMLTQYLQWIGGVLHFDFGASITNGVPVATYIVSSLPRTLELAFASILIAIVVGVPAGIAAARNRGGMIDGVLTTLSTLGVSVPVYILGSLFIVVFSLKLGLLPSSGYTDISRNAVEHFRKLALPAFTLGFGLASSIARMTRASMLEILSRDFVVALKAKGLAPSVIIYKHVLRNASIPIVAIIGLQLGNLMGGTVLVEALFNWPGMSTQLVSAVGSRNYPLVQGSVLVIAALFIFINMFVEIIYGILDPRIRRKRS